MATSERDPDSASLKPPPERWWKTLPAVIAAWAAAIGAVIAVITALKGMWTPGKEGLVDPMQPSRGAVGWIYAGNRIDDEWRKSLQTDPKQPAVTLGLQGNEFPKRGNSYSVIQAVSLRSALPVQESPGDRPPMSGAVSGTLYPGRTLVVDDVRKFHIVKEPPERTWIWTHVTLANDPVPKQPAK